MADIVNEPLVTVGICCYNREEGLKNTLKYITGQTYKNLEIIISQDYNPNLDFTSLIDEVNDNRITFFKQTQKLSMYGNFRFLLEKAGGQYFMWAADDDWWAPEFIAEIMKLLLADPAAALGFTNFMEVDEDNNRIAAYPDHLPLLNQFTTINDVQRIKNYISQFEAFGKANLFYSIFKTDALRTAMVLELLKKGDLPCDMLINLSVLTQGKLVVSAKMLRTCTVGNIKYYDQIDYQPKRLNFLIFYFYINAWKYLHKKWAGFIYGHFTVLHRSGLPVSKKIILYPSLIKKLLLFYYDLICNNVQLRGYNIFSKMRRKYTLN